MSFLSFTGLFGSMLHPFVMFFVCLGWFAVALFGLNVRNNRLKPSAESETLLGNGVATSKSEQHKRAAGTLLFFTVAGMLVGMGNTYLRDARLYPGPHLYGALFLVLALSANVALSVWFSSLKSLRVVHAGIGASVLLVVLLQMYSGFQITLSVIGDFF